MAIKTEAATASLLVGQTYQTEISATGYHYLSIESVTSSNPSVYASKMGLVVKATVNAYFSGEALVTARLRYQLYPGQDYQYRNQEFTISCIDTSISITPKNGNVKIGESLQMGYSFNRTTYVTPLITWSSSDESIATISNSGLVYGKKEGTVTIYAHSSLGSNVATSSISVSKSETSPGGGGDSSTGDTSWYDGAKNEFYLNSVSQLRGLRNLVNSGTNFLNKIIYITNDIDLSSLNWTTPIGKNDSYPFKGTVEGLGHSIKININSTIESTESYLYFGLFGYLENATIKNLTISGYIEIDIACNTSKCYVGSFSGYSTRLVNIENCINKAAIEFRKSYDYGRGSNSSYVGGICGGFTGNMINCINDAEITSYCCCTDGQYNDYFTGGLCGQLTDGGTIVNSANYKNIYSMRINDGKYHDEYVGGIAGNAFIAKIQSCSNIGGIYGHSNYSRMGGLIGYSGGNVNCSNSYVGLCAIRNDKESTSVYIDAIAGRLYHSGEIYSNNYSASDILYEGRIAGEHGIIDYSSDEMKTVEFAEILGDDWIGCEGLYPVAKGSPYIQRYYMTLVSEITCSSAKLTSNIPAVGITDVKSGGFLIRKDDGKESFHSFENGSYSITLEDLEPNRSYTVRWYAQTSEGNEYYGVENTFKTRALEPVTLDTKGIGVTKLNLAGEYYCNNVAKAGFYFYENDDAEQGVYVWSAYPASNYRVYVTDLKGNTTYHYNAVIEVDGIYYTGEEKTVTTYAIETQAPSDFTDTSAVINGEIGVEADEAHFEFRDTSLPSVIDPDVYTCPASGIVSVAVKNLAYGNTYKYRIVATKGETTYEGDWIEFLFQGESGIEDISSPASDMIDFSRPFDVYTISGVKVTSIIENLSPGIYIVRQGQVTGKIRL